VKYGHYYTAIASWCGFKINGFELSELTNAAAGALFLGLHRKNGAIIEIEGASQEFIPIRLH
jgi:hypothetical protein